PRFIDEIAPDKDLPRREAFASLLVQNPLFAKSVVNRYWAPFFGRAITEPVDDFSNRFKPSHPELLNQLAKDFVAHGYDLAWLVKSLANSHSYQLSSKKPENAGSDRLFTHAATRPLTPEQLSASILGALGIVENPGQGGGGKNQGAGLLGQFRQKFGDEDMADRGLFAGTIPQ